MAHICDASGCEQPADGYLPCETWAGRGLLPVCADHDPREGADG